MSLWHNTFMADTEILRCGLSIKTYLDLHICMWAALEFQCAVAFQVVPVAPVHTIAASVARTLPLAHHLSSTGPIAPKCT